MSFDERLGINKQTSQNFVKYFCTINDDKKMLLIEFFTTNNPNSCNSAMASAMDEATEKICGAARSWTVEKTRLITFFVLVAAKLHTIWIRFESFLCK